MAEKMGVDFEKAGLTSPVVKMTEDPPLNFSACSTHFCVFALCVFDEITENLVEKLSGMNSLVWRQPRDLTII